MWMNYVNLATTVDDKSTDQFDQSCSKKKALTSTDPLLH